MTKYTFVAFHKDVPKFLKDIQTLGVVDIRRSSKPIDATSKSQFETISTLKSLIRTTKQIEKDALKKNITIDRTFADQLDEGGIEEIINIGKELLERKSTLEKEFSATTKAMSEAEPWGDFNNDEIAKIEHLGYTPHFYCVDRKKFTQQIQESYPIQILNELGNKIYFVLLAKEGEMIKLKLKESEFPKFPYSQQRDKLESIKNQQIECYSKLMAIGNISPRLTNELERVKSLADLYLAGKSSEQTAEKTLYIFTAFAPTENSEAVNKFLDDSEVYYTSQKATTEDNPPIALRSNWFTRMFAPLTDMYGRPAYNEFDPTPYISVFFLLFFAMCMGDAGYGILLIIIGFLLRKSEGAKKFAPLVITLGIATTIIGFIFHTLFGIDIAQASWIPDNWKKFMVFGKIANYDAPMVIAIAIGVLHLCVAMLVKAIYSVKINGFKNSLSTIGWTLLIVGGVIVGAVALSGAIDSKVTKIIIITIGIISAIGIFFLGDLKKNPLANFGNGLWETYNTVTGLLGDVLSYIRLYALGLAGGMLGGAFNQLAQMAFDGLSLPGVNWLVFIIILVFGHVLNLAMCALGAFVHPLRLNFLEFFKNSGYQGSGKTFSPLTTNNNN